MTRLDKITQVLEQAIASAHIPGAVVCVGQGDAILLAEPRGARRFVPSFQPMQLDTIFDLASLTKPLVTAVLAMQLVEDGSIALSDPVSAYVPGFVGQARDTALIRDLLTHSSGLPPWKNYLSHPPTHATSREERVQAVVADICQTPLQAPPGERFIYSDLGFMLLGYIIEQATGKNLGELAAERVFASVGMEKACFNPPAETRDTCAATEVIDGQPLQGVVHDENARYLGGIAGHAGLFATAHDLARFCRMLLRGGFGDKARVLSPASVRAMTTPQSRHPGQLRGLGWDIASDYSVSVRGDLFPRRGFGHSGFTGVSIWVDPPSGVWVVLLTNRVHPTREGNVLPLRRRIANAVAAAFLERERPACWFQRFAEVRSGLEVEKQANWPSLRGKRLGLVINHTAVDRSRRHLLQLLTEAEDVHIARIFAPEHGFRGLLDEAFGDGADGQSGLPIVSLYGHRHAPTPDHIADLDALLFDIQDAGVRFYTYTATMCLCMKAAAEAGAEFIVFDRPNLLRLDIVSGPVLDTPFSSLAEYHPLPMIHGLTVGELAKYANSEYSIGANLTVVPCEQYSRDLWFDETGLPWVNPSPNLRTMKAAVLYPAIGMLERCNLSVGRGTDIPFQWFGAPWMDGVLVARHLNSLELPGLRFVPVEFTPTAREFAGQRCSGCYASLLDRESFQPVETGLHIAQALVALYGDVFQAEKIAGLLGSRQATSRLLQMREVEDICADWEQELQAYLHRRHPYLLY